MKLNFTDVKFGRAVMLEFQTFSKKREIRSLIYGESLSRVKGPPAYQGSYPGRANFSHIFFKNVEKRENENQKRWLEKRPEW